MSLLGELAYLEASGLLRLAQLEPEREYEFKHSMYRDSAYGLLLRQDRAELHGMIGAILERTFPDRLREIAPRLADHFLKAGQRETARKYSTMAGAASLRVHAYGEAVDYFEQALRLASDGTNGSSQLRRAYRDLGRALELAGRFEAARENYAAMREHGERLGNHSMTLAAMTLEATLYCTSSPLMDRERGRQLSRTSLAMARDLGDIEEEIRSRWNLLLSLGSIIGEEHKGLLHGVQALRLADENDLAEMVAFLRNDLGRIHLFCSNLLQQPDRGRGTAAAGGKRMAKSAESAHAGRFADIPGGPRAVLRKARRGAVAGEEGAVPGGGDRQPLGPGLQPDGDGPVLLRDRSARKCAGGGARHAGSR